MKFRWAILLSVLLLSGSWGFFAHPKINRLAVFTLPAQMSIFYKKNIRYIEEAAVNPDRRRYILPDEAPRHYIDLEEYGDSAVYKLPRYWKQAVEKFGEDSLQAHGILPWAIQLFYLRLKDALAIRDPEKILKYSADLGHYVADAHVPLHTTKNYDGQLTGQTGLHAFWESRLPELFYSDYNFYTGKAQYISNVSAEVWKTIAQTNQALDSVLRFEKLLSEKTGNNKFNFETKGKQTIKVFSYDYAKAYHDLLQGMVERQMRRSIWLTGSLWYSAWVDAGQPDLKMLINYKPSDEELKARVVELKKWKEERTKIFRDTLHAY
ncbi:MAG: S1/P1 Nuclease [Bacteroidetes bacterium]|nr:S1/P1 Nuclease [Bacteroidota bacterium]MBS1540742.1 S1/P1 Nuclease [Bacteroidota bacterium]